MKTLLAIFLLLPILSWGEMTDEDFKYKSVYVCGTLFNTVDSWIRYKQSAADLLNVQIINFDGKGNNVVHWGFDTYKSWEKTSTPHTYGNNGGTLSLDVRKVGEDSFVMRFTKDSRKFKIPGWTKELVFYWELIFDRKNKKFEAQVFLDDAWSVPKKNFDDSGNCVLDYKAP